MRTLYAVPLRRNELKIFRDLHATAGDMMYALPADDRALLKALRGANPHLVYDSMTMLMGYFTISRIGPFTGTFGLLIKPGSRRCGFGKKLLALVESSAADMGIPTLRADIYSSNAAALALVRSSGYREFVWLEKNIVSRKPCERCEPCDLDRWDPRA